MNVLVIIYLVLLAAACTMTGGVVMYRTLSQRTTTALKVFDTFINPSYTIELGQFPTEYYNPYYRTNMPYKVCDYYWATSAASYQPCGQTLDVCSYDGLVACMQKGARVLTLNVVAGDDGTPQVRYKTLMPYFGKALDFGSCLDLIKKWGWQGAAQYPLVLYLTSVEGPPSTALQNAIAAAITSRFSGMFPNLQVYGHVGQQTAFAQGPITDFLGKLVVVSGFQPDSEGQLSEMICAVFEPSLGTTPTPTAGLIPYTEGNMYYGGLKATVNNMDSLIADNKKGLTMVYPSGYTMLKNITLPMIDIYNPIVADCVDAGCQMIAMHYQYYDKQMQNYVEFFKEAGLVPKPDSLRDIPQPGKPVVPQSEELSFAPRTMPTYKFSKVLNI